MTTAQEDEEANALIIQSDRVAAIIKIDADTDALYGSVLGNRTEEYTSAAKDAELYKEANYTGAVPPGVQSWAAAKGWTPERASNDILITASAWIGAQNVIRAARLLRKEQVRLATSNMAITDALAAWQGFLAYIKKILGVA